MDTEFDFNNDELLAQMLEQAAQVRAAEQAKVKSAPSKFTQQGLRASNRERSGVRDMTLSANLRRVGSGPDTLSDDIRHKDNDFTQHCSKCSRAIAYIEGSTDPKKASTYIRAQAEDAKHLAFAVRIIHYANDEEGLKGVRSIIIWKNGREVVDKAENISWERVIKAFEKLQVLHIQAGSFGGCQRRASFK